MNPDLSLLQPYPFERLRQLLAGTTPPAESRAINLSIGEPKHTPPPFVIEALQQGLSTQLARYPLTKGEPVLREAIAHWLRHRFQLPALDPETEVLPVAGTREALFAFAQAVVDRRERPLVLMPNPFYQIYEGAALLAGAEPYTLPTTAENGFLPDLDAVPEEVWRRCQLFYLCSPGNPTGRVAPFDYLQRLLELANRYQFTLAADECYSELYPDEDRPPLGLLQVAAQLGQHDYRHCVVFHSLSKRSNLPGLRSGFVAGDRRLLEPFLLYRTYHGCALSHAVQQASVAAWSDEHHVVANRELYRRKFAAVVPRLTSSFPRLIAPDASFYLWLPIEGDDTLFARQFYQQSRVTLLPGQYLSRSVNGHNPGYGYLRMALVAPEAEVIEAAERLVSFAGQS